MTGGTGGLARAVQQTGPLAQHSRLQNLSKATHSILEVAAVSNQASALSVTGKSPLFVAKL